MIIELINTNLKNLSFDFLDFRPNSNRCMVYMLTCAYLTH